MRKPTIVFVAQSGTKNEYLDQSSRYRIYNPAKAFQRNGYTSLVVRNVYDETFPCYGDIYVFHRPSFSKEFFVIYEELSSKGAKLICDFDDLNFDPSTVTQNAFYKIRDRMEISNQVAAFYQGGSLFDTIITSSKTLTENAIRVFGSGKRYETIGMGVDDTLFDHVLQNKDLYHLARGRQTIGYFAGSNTHALDFPLIEEAVYKYLNENSQNKFLLMGQISPSKFLRSKQNFIHLPRMSYEEIFQHAAQCKVIVAPLQENMFNKVKASTKMIENALIGAYTCASPTPEFEFLGMEYSIARDTADWEKFCSRDFLQSLDGKIMSANFSVLREKFLMSKVIEQYKVVMGIN